MLTAELKVNLEMHKRMYIHVRNLSMVSIRQQRNNGTAVCSHDVAAVIYYTMTLSIMIH